jgi:hypothetical protein
MAAQIVTLTEPSRPQAVAKIVWDWTSAADGTVVSKTARGFTGEVVRVVIDSDASSTAPTAAYDLVINDDDGNDVINAAGADINIALVIQKFPKDGLAWVSNSNLTLSITNAGDAKGGLVYLYIRELLAAG